MTPMKARMSQSSRLDWGRTTAVTSTGWATAVSAMDGAPRIDPDPLAGQDHRDRALFGQIQPANEVNRKVGAQEHAVHGVAREVGAEERAEEGQGVDPGRQHIG